MYGKVANTRCKEGYGVWEMRPDVDKIRGGKRRGPDTDIIAEVEKSEVRDGHEQAVHVKFHLSN